ncbi:MAG: hypothetical protein HETSPECPRED_006863 [Heterodermia speciosa]|uniref:Uncharacterized protein n=1 Tax=Heterodermia speciosa TaxID=116794 RepID=A0A8H3IPG2_9LECA|nr:MAG: hypothetical protein HETSPECPRED_006863 [Heterodermia speciosa]
MKNTLDLDDETFENIASFVAVWAIEGQQRHLPQASLPTRELAERWADTELRDKFNAIFSRIPNKSKWDKEAPYGFVKVVVGRLGAFSRKGKKGLAAAVGATGYTLPWPF